MSSILFQLVCWHYLPDFATRQVLSLIHHFSQRVLGIPPPRARSPDYVRHYRYTYAGVVLCYLVYNFIEAMRGLPENFYQLLGVSPQGDEGAIKAAFRAFAKKHHPDRTGPGGEAHFIDVRDAFEALKDPVVRFAYDRFGPDVLGWQDCTTIRDYLRRGLVNWLLRHVMTFGGLFLLSVVGKRSPIVAWRYLLFTGVFAMELFLIVTPSSSSSAARGAFVDEIGSDGVMIESLFPRHVRYQHILFLQQVFVFVSVAVSRVAGVLFAGTDEEMELGLVRAMGGRVAELSKGVERALWEMLNAEMSGTGDILRDAVVGEMEDMVVEDKLRGEDGPMRSAWERVARGKMRARSKSL